jgi:hypothetical protein
MEARYFTGLSTMMLPKDDCGLSKVQVFHPSNLQRELLSAPYRSAQRCLLRNKHHVSQRRALPRPSAECFSALLKPLVF